MKFDIEKLDAKGRQELFDNLHATGLVPTILYGTGTPMHVAMLGSQINDLRQVVSIQTTNLNRVFNVLDRQGITLDAQRVLIDKMIDWFDPYKQAERDRLPGERDH